MVHITKEQILKINNKCSNGWKFNVESFCFHNEKSFIKQIKIDDEHYLEFTLRYNSENQILLHISKFYQEKGKEYATTSGMGKHKLLSNEVFKRKSIHYLINFTKSLNDSELLEINKTTKPSTGYGVILPSEDF